MDSTESKSVMMFLAATSNLPAGFTSKAENHSVPDYWWKRNSDGKCTDLGSAPPTGWATPTWGDAFIPTNYSLPGRHLSTPRFTYVLVRDSGIPAGELFHFACQFGPVIQARHMTNEELVSMTAVLYENRLHAYRCFDELYVQGYVATIMIISALSAKELQRLNEIQRPLGVDPEWFQNGGKERVM